MDEFTKKKVRRAMKDNPDTHIRFIIAYIRSKQNPSNVSKFKRRSVK